MTADTFSFLSKQANSYPPLAAGRDTELALAAKAGDRAARDKLVKHSLRYVVQVCLANARYGLPLEDLYGEGCVGLLDAIERFDPTRGTRFVTYAVFWVKARVVKYCLTQRRLVRGSSSRTCIAFRLMRVCNRHAGKPREMLVDAVAREFDVPIDRADAMVGETEYHVSEYHDFVEGDALNPEDAFAEAEMVALSNIILGRAIEGLTPRQRRLVERKWLETDGEHRVNASIARGMGISRERVRQLDEIALKRLREIMNVNPRRAA